METQVKNQTTNEALVKSMNVFLADLQVFYQNLRGFHWNVEGNLFFTLHAKFEEYYNETAEAVDEVAERILMVGGKPVHSFSEYVRLSDLPETTDVHEGKEAVRFVIDQSNVLLKKMKQLLDIANEQDDEATATLFSDMISETEKRVWMLKTFLK